MVHITDEFDTSLAIDVAAIRRIIRLYESRVGPSQISVQCSDNISRDFNSVDELDHFENSPNKAIRFLAIDARNEAEFECPKSVRSVELHFHRTGRVSIRIFGAEREGIYFRDELKEIIYGMQPWYGWIARRLASYLRTIFVLTTWIVFLAYLYIVMGPIVIVAPKPEWSPMFEATAVTVGVMLITWVPFWVINNVISALQVRMFPVVAFATGQGEKRQKHAEVGRVLTLTVVSGGIVSLLVGGFFIVV